MSGTKVRIIHFLGKVSWFLMTASGQAAEVSRLLMVTCAGQVAFPSFAEISVDAKDLVTGLLESDPNKRLGHGPCGIQEIFAHPWLSGVNWKVRPTFRAGLQPAYPCFTSFRRSLA